MTIKPDHLIALGAELYARRDEGTILPFAEAKAEGWLPTEHECHNNCATWAANMPGFRHVRGFLFFDLAGALPYVWFNAHSVIEHEGKLFDITPSRASDRYPFLRHIGGDDLFAAAEAQVRLTHFK